MQVCRDDGPRRNGHLFVLKNRLPPDMTEWEMPSPLTPEEIEGEFIPSFDNEKWDNLRPVDLGGCGLPWSNFQRSLHAARLGRCCPVNRDTSGAQSTNRLL